MPEASIEMLVRKGNESLLKGHPFLNELLIWDKSSSKFSNLLSIASTVRAKKYDVVVNPHRYSSSGFIAWRSAAKQKLGFDKNPLSWTYTKSFPHLMEGQHEVERNQTLIAALTDEQYARPRLYPSHQDFDTVSAYKSEPYLCIAPTSVWSTKQWPAHKWISLIKQADTKTVFLLGAPTDKESCEQIRKACPDSNVQNLCGSLNLLESAALMRDAKMNYVNDSAPLHLASAMNAPVRAVFNSTITTFGFTPLSDDSKVIETSMNLDCRPCGVHGHQSCPKGHFNCAESIEVDRVLV